MTTINLADMNVQSCTLTVRELYDLLNGELEDDGEVETIFQVAQDNIRTGLYPKTYVVIEVIPDTTEEQNPAT